MDFLINFHLAGRRKCIHMTEFSISNFVAWLVAVRIQASSSLADNLLISVQFSVIFFLALCSIAFLFEGFFFLNTCIKHSVVCLDL